MRSAMLLTVLAALPLCAQVKFTQQPGRVLVEIDGKPYTTWFLAPGGNKPYLYPLSTASGAVVTRHFPMEQFAGETNDHPHQRGLFFSHGDVNGFNFWATEADDPNPKAGRMALKGAPVVKGATVQAVFEGRRPDGKAIMTETRSLHFASGGGLRIIDFEIAIEPLEKLTFGDTKEGTFGIRLATTMDENKGGRMVNAAGQETEKNVWGKRSPWVDYSGPVNGETVGIAIFDHPANPRHPTYWHSRAYGLFAANPFGVRDFTGDKAQDGSLTIVPGETLRFRYRVVIHSGNAVAAGVPELHKRYTSGR